MIDLLLIPLLINQVMRLKDGAPDQITKQHPKDIPCTGSENRYLTVEEIFFLYHHATTGLKRLLPEMYI